MLDATDCWIWFAERVSDAERCQLDRVAQSEIDNVDHLEMSRYFSISLSVPGARCAPTADECSARTSAARNFRRVPVI